MAVLSFGDASFSRHGRTLLRPVSLTVECGEKAALACESASAAWIAARMAAGIVKCTSGSVFVCDFDPKIQPVHVKRFVGLVPCEPPRVPLLAEQYFAYRAALWGLDEREAVERGMTLLSMSDGLDRAQQLALAGALLHAPALLILERPGDGLRAAAEAMLGASALFATYGPGDRAVPIDASLGARETP